MSTDGDGIEAVPLSDAEFNPELDAAMGGFSEHRHEGLVVKTSTYWRFRPAHGVAIRITVGAPDPAKYPDVVDLSRLLAPWGALGKEDWRERYRARLDRLGAPRIISALCRTWREHGRQPLILCCWEADPADCHRGVLAEFLRSHGVQVAELRTNRR